MKICRILTIYLDAHRHTKSHNTDLSRSRTLCKYLGGILHTELTHSQIQDYYELRSHQKTVRGTPPSPATRRNEIELLSRAFSYSLQLGLVEKNPVASVPLPTLFNARDRVLSPSDQAKLLAHDDKIIVDFVVLSLALGWRKSEILYLQKEQITFNEGYAIVRVQGSRTKEKRGRVTVVMGRALDVLQERYATNVVWIFEKAGGVHIGRIDRRWRRACKALSLDDVVIHDLRRTFATESIEKGIPAEIVCKMGGWANPKMIRERYLAIHPDRLVDLLRGINDTTKTNSNQNQSCAQTE